MRETLMTTTDKNNFKIKMERVRDRNIFHSNKAQDLFTYGVNRPKITSIPDSDKKIIEERMCKYFTQPSVPKNVINVLSDLEMHKVTSNDEMAIQVEWLTNEYQCNPANALSYQVYTAEMRNQADENIARYTNAQKTQADNLIYEGLDQSPNVQDSILAAYQIGSAILLSAIVEVSQFLASLILNIGLWVEVFYTNFHEFIRDINTNISEGFIWALDN